MRRWKPTVLCIGETLTRFLAALALFSALVAGGTHCALAGGAAVQPTVLAEVQTFRGRLAYSGHRTDRPGQSVNGTLDVANGHWALDERSSTSMLHVSSAGSWLRTGSQALVFDDPFEVGTLVNSWAVVLGESSGAAMEPTAISSSWMVGQRLRLYLDAMQREVIGISDIGSSDGISFAYGDWMSVNGVQLPQSVVRMRNGVPVASFLIGSYQVQSAAKTAATMPVTSNGHHVPVFAEQSALRPHSEPSAMRAYIALFSLFFLGLAVVAWTRRESLFERLCRRLAQDPRGWRSQGINVFVSPEGTLFFEGRPYHVGAVFYNQATLVQSSALFIRVSAPGVSKVLILARKFSTVKTRRELHKAQAGFTLVEALAAASLFAVVIVASVFPALIVIARADRLAAQHALATQIAANALADEEAAVAYGSIDDSQVTSVVDGMTLTVTLAPQGITGLHNVIVQVTGSDGRPLARLATMIGPPVPAPGATIPPG